jgi:hypothetical protein
MLVLLVSWFLARYAAACRQHRAAVALAKRGATVCYDYQYGASGFDPCLQPPDSGFLLRWLGRDFIHRIVEIDCSHARPIGFRDRTAFVGDGDAEALAHLPDLREINLAGQPITDAGLAPLARLRSLSRLILSETDITDSGLSHLETLRSLALLKLDETKVTAAAVERLRERLPGARITFNTVENTIWDQRRKQ